MTRRAALAGLPGAWRQLLKTSGITKEETLDNPQIVRHTSTRARAYNHTCTHMRARTHSHAHTHTHAHAHTRARTHTRTRASKTSGVEQPKGRVLDKPNIVRLERAHVRTHARTGVQRLARFELNSFPVLTKRLLCGHARTGVRATARQRARALDTCASHSSAVT